MKSLKEQFIVEVVGEAVNRSLALISKETSVDYRNGNTPGVFGRPVRVLDLGCGGAGYVAALLEEFPTIDYVGVEPIEASFKTAQKNLAGVHNAKVHFQLGYDSIPNEAEASFDVVFSLSVLEHIKHLDRFLALGTKYTKTGGLVVHRYDLGHALHTHSVKEAIHVWMGNNIPGVLPERQFVRYVPEPEVRALYEAQGLTPFKTTYHQMPSHKAIEKQLKTFDTKAIEEIFAWEMKYQNDILKIPVPAREKLFPAVAVWGEKR